VRTSTRSEDAEMGRLEYFGARFGEEWRVLRKYNWERGCDVIVLKPGT
jgi:hypothetical protein